MIKVEFMTFLRQTSKFTCLVSDEELRAFSRALYKDSMMFHGISFPCTYFLFGLVWLACLLMDRLYHITSLWNDTSLVRVPWNYGHDLITNKVIFQ